uniref:Uncharacterized protein n=1 Tax=Rhizophora mucronata TaxID=61149 RepID=A0A2P2PA74_RHIMU
MKCCSVLLSVTVLFFPCHKSQWNINGLLCACIIYKHPAVKVFLVLLYFPRYSTELWVLL